MESGHEDLLRRMTEAHGVPGYEDEVREIFYEELAAVGDFETDGMGSVVCDAGGDGSRVLLTAHMDEVGFRVQSVTSSGFIQIVEVGGWWTHTLLSQQVVIKTACGEKITGVIASKPPHFLSEVERKKVMTLEHMFVDIGARSREEVEGWGIALGDPVAPRSSFEKMRGEDRYLAKAFDNRAGMTALVLAGKELAKSKRENRLLLGATVQEEVGLRGVQTLAAVAKPDVAVLLEGTPADDTPGFKSDTAQAKLGHGVQIRMHDPSAVMNPKLAALAIEVAKRNGILHQVAVRRSGGTDAGRLHLSGEGVPCVVLGVPARYIHTHGSVIEGADFEAAVQLSVELVKALTTDSVAELTNFL